MSYNSAPMHICHGYYTIIGQSWFCLNSLRNDDLTGKKVIVIEEEEEEEIL